MCTRGLLSGALVVFAWTCGLAFADPMGVPTFTYREFEDNDRFSRLQVIDAEVAVVQTGSELVRDCLFINGKLQSDCVWDNEPKCSIRVLGKPLQSHDEDGFAVFGLFAEPSVAYGPDGVLTGVPITADRIIRLAVTSIRDSFDGTTNGLAQNGPHEERGLIRVELYYDQNGAPVPAGQAPDAEYTFRMQNGADALRVAFRAPAGVSTVDIRCREDIGAVEVCWDTDFFEVRNLVPHEPYCVTVVGGLDEECIEPDLLLGWFDKDGLQIGGPEGSNGQGGFPPFPEICVFADEAGSLRFAVTGTGDQDFNGVLDSAQPGLRELELQLDIVFDVLVEWVGGASVKDGAANEVVRLSRDLWSELGLLPGAPLERSLEHGVCGGYTIKIRRGDHVDDPDDGGGPGALRTPDLNGDGRVDSIDLALMLSSWGSVL